MTHLRDPSELRQLLHATKKRPVRGNEAIAVFSRARQAWLSEPSWQARAAGLIRDFHAARGSSEDATEIDLQNLQAIPEFMDPRAWLLKLEVELGSERALDGLRESTSSLALTTFEPHGVLMHVCPGNSYLGGLDSVLHGILTGNINLAKLSRNTPAIMDLLVELLERHGLPQGQLLTVTWDAGFERQAIALIDATVVWGSEETIKAYRAILPTGAKLIEYGPKLSFSIITAQGWKMAQKDQKLLERLAADACRFEQMSCSSSQVLLIEEPEPEAERQDTQDLRAEVLAKVGEAFAAYARHAPPTGRGKHQWMELLKAVEHAKLHAARTPGADLRSGFPDWLLVWKSPTDRIEPSPLMRTWQIHTYRKGTLQGLKNKLDAIRTYLQTASVLCSASERQALCEELWSLGVNRVVDPGRSTEAMAGAPHDGGYILRQFCRVVSLESPDRSEQLWFNGSQALTLRKIQNLLKTAQNAPFYRKRFEISGLDPEASPSWESFARLPWLRKEDLNDFGPPFKSDLLTVPYEQARGAYLFTTGGSTGSPKYALYSKPEWEEVTDIFCQEFRASGLTERDRVANLFVGGGLWSAFIATTEGLQKLGCLNLPIGNMDPLQTLKLFEDLGATAVFGLPSTLLRLAHALEENPQLKVKLRTVLYGGEHMSEPMRSYVQRVFSAQVVKSGSYAAVDAGCIGYQCRETSGGVHHGLENYCHIEICDEETGLPVPTGQAGEIIVTNLSRTLFPIIRLRTGDRGRVVQGPCACRSHAFTFELLGRSDDMVRVGGANVFASDVDRLCGLFPELLSLIYQLRISKCGVDDALELVIESKDGPQVSQAQERLPEIRHAYLEIAEDLEHYLKEGFLKHFCLVLAAPGTISAQAKTGKIRRVVDSRP